MGHGLAVMRCDGETLGSVTLAAGAAEGEVSEGGSVEAGWIVLGDGTQRGSVNITDPETI